MHGVGICDEWPLIAYPDQLVKATFDYELQSGTVQCVEALISPDGGDFSIKLEDQVLVTDDGFKNLSLYPYDDQLMGIARLLMDDTGNQGLFDPRSAGCRLLVDNGASQKIATVAGAGISVNSLWCIHQEINNGTLVRVMDNYEVNDQTALWLVYPKSNVLTAKVRIFIDFLLEKISSPLPWSLD